MKTQRFNGIVSKIDNLDVGFSFQLKCDRENRVYVLDKSRESLNDFKLKPGNYVVVESSKYASDGYPNMVIDSVKVFDSDSKKLISSYQNFGDFYFEGSTD
jgi:hypothetical protein